MEFKSLFIISHFCFCWVVGASVGGAWVCGSLGAPSFVWRYWFVRLVFVLAWFWSRCIGTWLNEKRAVVGLVFLHLLHIYLDIPNNNSIL